MKYKEIMFIITVVLLASAALNGLVRDDFTNIISIVFSVLGSLSLLVTIILYSQYYETPSNHK